MSDFSYRLGAGISRMATRVFTQMTVRGREHIPQEGGCLLVCNHISHFDPNLLGMSVPPRCVDYMADLPLLKIPVVGAMLKSWNAFPIDRSKPIDRASIRMALERLANGRIVGIFPERGLRYGDKSILNGAELPAGTAALWQMARVPALPALIIGSDQLYQWRNWFRRPRVFVFYGPMLAAPAKDESREASRDRMAGAICALYDQLKSEFTLEPHELPSCPQDRFRQRDLRQAAVS